MARGISTRAAVLLALGILWAPCVQAQSEDVTWQNAVGVSATGNSLTKTGAAGWNAGAASREAIEFDGYVEFSATETNTLRTAGLSKGDSNQTAIDIDFGIRLTVSGGVEVYENSVFRGSFGSYVSGDRFRVETGLGRVRYRKNGTVFYTSTVAPAHPLVVDTSLYTTGATLTDVRIGGPSWTGDVGVTVADRTLTKTGAVGWNAGAASVRRIDFGDGYVEATATETDKARAFGLSNGDAGTDVADIDFAVHLRSDATLEVLESGVSRGSFGAYATGDRVRVEVSGGVVRYLANDVVFYTSAVPPVYPLLADTALNDSAATLTDIALVDLVWTSASGVSVSASSLKKTGSAGWNAGAVSTASLSGDGFCEFTATETNTSRIAGLNNWDGGYDAADLDFGILLTSSGGVEVHESGVLRGSFGTYVSGDRFRVEVQLGVVKYRKNGVVFYTSSVVPTWPLVADSSLDETGATLSDVLLGDIVWKNDVGVAVWGTGLVKTGVSGDNAGGSTTLAVASGDAFVEFAAQETITIRSAGLGTGDEAVAVADVDFAIRLNVGTVQVLESGVLRGSFGSYVAGDRFRVDVEAGVVRYRKNGIVFYTSGLTPQYPLVLDTALYSTAATVPYVILGFTSATQAATPVFTPGAGTYTSNLTVAITTATPGATVRYTTDASEPTVSSPTYAGPISVTLPATLSAKAFKDGLTASDTATAVYTLKAATPAFSPLGGSYSASQTVTLTSTAGSTVHYTANGVDPTETDPSVPSGGTVAVDQSLTLKARSWKSGWVTSEVASATYTLSVVAPSLSPGGGSYSGAQSVTVSTTTPSAVIHYTLTGAEPTELDPTVVSGSSVTVDRSATLKAKAWRTGWTTSGTTTATYLVTLGTVAIPTLTPPPGTYTSPQAVTLSCATPGATIRYTLDGSEPTLRSRAYPGAIVVDGVVTVKAKAFLLDWTPSAAASGLYTIDTGAVSTPTLSPDPGVFVSGPAISLTTATAGAEIRFTTDGTDPTSASTLHTGPIPSPSTIRLKARAFKAGLADSAVASGDYWVSGDVAASVVANRSLAVKGDGTVYQWGAGTSMTPVHVSGLSDVVSVAVLTLSNIALKRDGTVWSWSGSGTPVQVPGLTDIVGISGADHALAVKRDGTVYRWTSGTATQVAGLSGVVAVSAGVAYDLALRTDGGASGVVWSWGSNINGQLGDGTSNQAVPTPRSGPGEVVAVAASQFHSLLVKADGSVWGTGYNSAGQVGDGTTTQHLVWTKSILPGPSTAIAAGTHGLARRVDGGVWSWGTNGSGQTGDGMAYTAKLMPGLVWPPDMSRIAAGPYHSLSVGLDGQAWAWGSNFGGCLGDGTTTPRRSPIPIPGLTTTNGWLTEDSDGDGLRNFQELQLGTDPAKADSNGDGIPDGAQVASGQSATNLDMDGDGISNAVEASQGTDPFRADTDGDASPDGVDCFPLDPARWECPPPVPGDTTPPDITLTEPTSATLISSVP